MQATGELIASGTAVNMNVEWTRNANPTGVGGAGGGGGACFHPFVRTFFHTPHPIHIRPFLWLRLVEAFSLLVSLLFHVEKPPMTVWSMMIAVEATANTGIVFGMSEKPSRSNLAALNH